MKKTDIVIIGAGPAGITAAIYAQMDKAGYILIEEKEPCWFLKESINSHYYANGFPGISKKITGTNLQQSFLDHYKRIGGKILKDRVLKISKINQQFKVKTTKNEFLCKAIIITSGTTPKLLDILGSKIYQKQIHHFCTIDGKKYIGKNIAVIGGRNSGAVAACYLHDIGCKVSIIEVQNELQCKTKYKKQLLKRNIKIYTSTVVKKFAGKNKKLNQIVAEQNDKKIKIPASGIFLYIGIKPALEYCNFKFKTNEQGFLIIDEYNQTSQKNIFAAGDITCKLKQAITACGDGANAYYFADKMINN